SSHLRAALVRALVGESRVRAARVVHRTGARGAVRGADVLGRCHQRLDEGRPVLRLSLRPSVRAMYVMYAWRRAREGGWGPASGAPGCRSRALSRSTCYHLTAR